MDSYFSAEYSFMGNHILKQLRNRFNGSSKLTAFEGIYPKRK